MKIGVLIPTRGDRAKLLNFAIKQLDRQTKKPDVIELVNDLPLNQDKDITWRYRIGCERLMEKGVDVIFLIEDDDWYSPTYIERQIFEWEKAGKPLIFGIADTTYYHLGIRAYNHLVHNGRASAFSTLITVEGVSRMKWPKDNYPFTDIELWKVIPGKTFIPEKLISLGIKGHNTGALFGGIGHNSQWGGYKQKDQDFNWLKSIVDEEAFEFYKNIVS